MFCSEFSHVFLEYLVPSLDVSAHWHISCDPWSPWTSILSLSKGLVLWYGRLLKISLPRVNAVLIFPSKQVGLMSESVDPRTVFNPFHTIDIYDRGSWLVVHVEVRPDTDVMGVVAIRANDLIETFSVSLCQIVS